MRRVALRRRAVLAVTLVVVAACGSPDGPTDEEARVGDYVDTRVTTTLPGGLTVPGATTATTVSPLTTAPRALGPRTTIDIGHDPATTIPQTQDPVTAASYGPPGYGAGTILQSVDAPKLVVELIVEANARFPQDALDRMLADLRQFSGKQPEVVRVTAPNGDPSRKWTVTDAHSYVEQYKSRQSAGDTFVLHYIAARGGMDPENGYVTLGFAFRADSFMYMQDTGIGLDQKQTRALFVHEQGHLLGLVDNYLQRNRHDTAFDPAKHGHSKNSRSVMYYAVQPGLNIGTPFDSTSDQFDTEDIRDLQAIKAGAPRGSNPKF